MKYRVNQNHILSIVVVRKIWPYSCLSQNEAVVNLLLPEALTVECMKERMPCPVSHAAATVSLSSLAVLVGLPAERSLVNLALGGPTVIRRL